MSLVPSFDKAAWLADDSSQVSGQSPKGLSGAASVSLATTTSQDELDSLMTDRTQDKPQKSKFFHHLKRPKKSYKRAHYVPVNGRDELVRQIQMGNAVPNLDYVMKLGMHLITGKFDYQSLTAGACLMEWANVRGVDFTMQEQILLAKTHHEIFMNMDLYGEQYNLRRSKELFKDVLDKSAKNVNGFSMQEEKILTTKQAFCKTLCTAGDGELLQEICGDVLEIITRNSDKGISDYYLMRGSAFKDIQNYDEAANCFFEAINGTLLPGRLSRLEMLFIITRNLNQLEAERARREKRTYIHDYQMIYLQMVQDKEVAKSVSYEDWLGDFHTWVQVADKLRLLGLFSLAADMMSQGLMFDDRVFQDNNVWWKFAKAYWRCGRTPDALSAIAQALAITGDNTQYISVSRSWWVDPHEFEHMVHTWPAWDICNRIPSSEVLAYPAQMKLRVLLKVSRERLKAEIIRKAEEERLRLREEAKQKALESGQTVGADGRTKIVKDRNKANPKVLWNNPEAIMYPSKLTPKECCASCKDMEGEFEYYPGTDSPPLPAGEHTIVCEFTPKNTKKYNCVEIQVVLIIHKATPIVKYDDPPVLYNGASLSSMLHLNAKLVENPADLVDNDDDAGGGKKRKKRKQKDTMEFSSKVGNARQMVDAPDGTFEYYLDPQDPDLELPPEDEAEIRLFNDDYYLEQAKNDKEKVNEMDVYPWPRLEVGQRLPVGHHRVLCHFKPFDLVSYVRVRTMVFIKVVPKVVPPIVWRPPKEAMTHLTPLSKIELDAKVKKVKGKFRFYHCLTEEDIAEPAYQEELRLKKLKKEEEERELAEMKLMHPEDPWVIHKIDHSNFEAIAAVAPKVEEDPDKVGKKGKKKRMKKKSKKGDERGVTMGEAGFEDGRTSPLTFTDGRASPTKSLGGGSIESLDGTLASGAVDYSDQPVSVAYTEALALTKKLMGTSGYVLPTGACRLLTIFTPEDRIKYDMGVMYVTINVVQAQPEIKWTKQVPPCYSDALFDTETHLNAVLTDTMDESGSGKFVYTITTVVMTRSMEEQAEKEKLDAYSEDEEDAEIRCANYVEMPPTGPRVHLDNIEPHLRPVENEKMWYPTGETPEEIGLLPKGHHTIQVEYFPKDRRNYKNALFIAEVTTRCKPPIFWNEEVYADQLRHGQAVGEEQLCAYVTECPGDVSYTPEMGEFLEVGFYQVKAKFIPVDSTIHDVSYSTRNLQIVRKIVPRVDWTIESSLFGEPVDEENICSATCKLPGYFTYNIELGTKLDAGSYSVTATFHPEDTVTYAISTAVNQLIVKKLQIVIEFLPEDDILDLSLTYGTPLSEKQFCAQVTFPPEDEIPHMFGIMSYSYEEGDFLPTGTNTMTASYEPLPPYDKNYIMAVTKTTIEMTRFIPTVIWEAPQAVVYGTGHLNSMQFNAELLWKVIPPPGTFMPPSTMVPRSRKSRSRTAGNSDSQDVRMSTADYNGSAYGSNSPLQFDDGNGAGVGTGIYAGNANLQERSQYTEGPQVDFSHFGSQSQLEVGGSVTTPGHYTADVSGMGPQVGFDLSQVSLGIYTDYGASTVEGPSTYGPGGNFDNEGSVLLLDDGNSNSIMKTTSNTPMPTVGGSQVLFQESSVEIAPIGLQGIIDVGSTSENQGARSPVPELYRELSQEHEYPDTLEGSGGALDAGPSHMGSLTVDEATYDIRAGSIDVPASGASIDETETSSSSSPAKASQSRKARMEEQEDNNAGVGEEKGNDKPKVTTGYVHPKHMTEEEIEAQKKLPFGGTARLKIAEGTEMEAYSTKKITHVLPNMPFDPALEGHVVGSKIRGNNDNTSLEAGNADEIAIHGTFRYIPDIGHVFANAGVYVLRAIFEPDDKLNIGTAEASVEITVLKARPTVRWKQPIPIFDKTPLSPLHLCATVHCPGLKDGVDGQFEYFPNRGEVLGVGLHVLRCRYVPFQRSAHNFDCSNSWAEVPLLVKNKPFNAEYLDNLAPKGSKASVKKKKKKTPKDSWVAGMAWPESKEVISQSQRHRPATIATADTTSLTRDKAIKHVLTADSTTTAGGSGYAQQSPIKKKKDIPGYKLSDEWEISPRSKQGLDTIGTNIHAASQARELLSAHARGARNFSPGQGIKLQRAHTSPDAGFLPLLSQGSHQSLSQEDVGQGSKFMMESSAGEYLPTGDDLINQEYMVMEESEYNDVGDNINVYGVDKRYQNQMDFTGSFNNSYDGPNPDENYGGGDFQRVSTAKNNYKNNGDSYISNSNASVETASESASAAAVFDVFGRPVMRENSDKNQKEWIASYTGEKMVYPKDGMYAKIGSELNFAGGIPLDQNRQTKDSGEQSASRGQTASPTGSQYQHQHIDFQQQLQVGSIGSMYSEVPLDVESNAYLMKNMDPQEFKVGRSEKLSSDKVFQINNKKPLGRAKTASDSVREPNPGMHFGSGNSGKHTTQTIDDIMKKGGKESKVAPFKWNMFVDVRNVFDEGGKGAKVHGNKIHEMKATEKVMREDQFRPISSADQGRNKNKVDKKLDEEAARRQLVRLERQINSLRRDAYGIAKMVTYAEKMRAKTTSSANRNSGGGGANDEANLHASTDYYDEGDMGSMDDSRFNPYTGEIDPEGDESTVFEKEDSGGIGGDPQGLNRVPGIGTGAAKRVVNSYDMSHPYLDITVHSLNKEDPTPEGRLYRTGNWPGGFKETYAISTSSSDRLTDTATMFKGVGSKKKKTRGSSDQHRPGTTGTGLRNKPTTEPHHQHQQNHHSIPKPQVQRDPSAYTAAGSSIDVISHLEREFRVDSPPRVPGGIMLGKEPAGNAVNAVRKKFDRKSNSRPSTSHH